MLEILGLGAIFVQMNEIMNIDHCKDEINDHYIDYIIDNMSGKV